MRTIERIRNRTMPEQLGFELRPPPTKRIYSLSTAEVFENFDAELLYQIREDRRFERKSANMKGKDMAPSLSMFANNSPDGGLLVIGVEDDGTVTGFQSQSEDAVNQLEKAFRDHCPESRYEIKQFPVQNCAKEPDYILLVYVKYREDRLVETTKGDAYIRIGDTKRRLSDEERAELRNLKGQARIELDPVDLTFPDDFKIDLLEQFGKSVRERRGLAHTTDLKEILEIRRLGRITDGKFNPNLACAMVFAKDPCLVVPGARIRFLRFEGTTEGTGDRFNAIKDVIVEAPIPEAITRIEEILTQQLRDFTRLGSDGKFYTAPEYPRDAWYEMIVNACVHRSYVLQNMNIFVKMFDDRLEVESPGGFPPMVTPENIYDMHQPRNPFLMDALYDLDFVKCAHEGTRRIRDMMKSVNLPEPEFRQVEVASSLVRVTLRNDIQQRKVYVDSDAFERLGAAIASTLTERERRIVNFAAENGAINVSQVQRLTGQTWPSARKTLGKLVERGIFEHHHRSDLERDPQATFSLKNM